MISHLNNVTRIVDTYKNLTINSGQELSILLKDLTCELFYLEKHRSDYHEHYNSIVHSFKGSNAGGVVFANEEVPELYMLRRVMNAGYRVVDALRSKISYIKKELWKV